MKVGEVVVKVGEVVEVAMVVAALPAVRPVVPLAVQPAVVAASEL